MPHGIQWTGSTTGCRINGAPIFLMYNTKVFPQAPTSWDVVFKEMTLPDGKSNKDRVQAYVGPIYIADAALYLKSHNPELGITDPYELNEKQFDAAVALLQEQRKIVSKYWSDIFDAGGGLQDGGTSSLRHPGLIR